MVGILGALGAGALGGASVNIVINAIDRFSKVFARAGVGLKQIGLAAGIMGVAAAAGIGALVKKAATLQTAFRNVDVILGETGAAEERFGEEVRRLTRELPIQGGRIAVLSGLYEVISAGITDTADATALLDTATRQAVAGNINMTTSVKALTSIMRGFGMEFSQASIVSSKLFRTVDLGQVTFEEISGTIGQLIPFADALGVSLNELLAGMASLSGVTGDASEVATQFRSIMGAIIKPTQQMQDVLTALGFATGEAAIKELGFLETLKAINEAAKENNLGIGKILGRKEALTAFFALIGESAETYAGNLEEITGATDLLDEKTGIATDSIASDWTSMVNNINLLLEDFGGVLGKAVAPLLEEVAEFTGKLSDKFDELSPQTKELIGIFILVGTATLLIVAAIALLGFIIASVGAIFAAIVALIVAGILLIITIIKNWGDIVIWFEDKWNSFTNFLGRVWFNFKVNFINDINDIIGSFEGMINFIIRGINRIKGFLGLKLISEISFGRLAVPERPPVMAPEEVRELFGLPAPTFNFNIENINGLDAEDVSKALSDELSAKVSL